jgi:hypothetical protein
MKQDKVTVGVEDLGLAQEIAPEGHDIFEDIEHAAHSGAGDDDGDQIRLNVPGNQLAFIKHGRYDYLTHLFDDRQRENGVDRVSMSWWRWQQVRLGLHFKFHHRTSYAFLVKRFGWMKCLLVPAWHRRLLAEGAAHADVMFTPEDEARLKKHVKISKQLRRRAEVLEKAESATLTTRLHEETKDSWFRYVEALEEREAASWRLSFVRNLVFVRFGCLGWLSELMVAWSVSSERLEKRKKLVETHLLATVDEHKQLRLQAEQQMQDSLSFVPGMIFGAFIKEKAPMDVEETWWNTFALWSVWAYIVLLAYYCMMLMVAMKGDEATTCLYAWVGSFCVQNLFTQPAILGLTQTLVPALIAVFIVKPYLKVHGQHWRAGVLKNSLGALTADSALGTASVYRAGY